MHTYATCIPTDNQLSKRTGYYSLFHRNMNVNSKTGHIHSNFRKRREKFAFTIKTYEFDNP